MSEMIPDRFQILFREHYPTVLRKISGLIADRAVAEDLAQEVFLRLYRNPPQELNSMGAWLHRVLTNVTYDYLRKSEKTKNLLLKEQSRYLTEEQVHPSSDTIVIENWEKEVVRKVLHKLSDRDREALLLKEKGYSYQEIAAILQVKPKTVGPLLMRASARFQRNFRQEEALDQ